MKLTLALHEALTNAVIHGNLEIPSALKDHGEGVFADAVAARCADPRYSGRVVDVVAEVDEAGVRWVVTDEGPGFDTEAALLRLEEEADPLRPYGRGLALMRAFVDGMRYEAGGRRLVLEVSRVGSGASRVGVPPRRDPLRCQGLPARGMDFLSTPS
jgi:anti-sigma regulatory factor (Ser/Thr protein kinase)